MTRDPPSARITAELRRRIASGRLRPGERVPSTRAIAREWQVAIATATKVLAALKSEGLVRMVPGVGTVVAAPGSPRPRGPSRPPETPEFGRDTVVRAAIAVADAEGLGEVSMRRVATELGVATMSLYRHVGSKDELVSLMANAAFGEEPPSPSPGGWRAQLERSARAQWRLYQRHPWLAGVVSMTRPQPLPNGIAYTDWALAALDGYGFDATTLLHAATCLFAFVRGIAVDLEPEARAAQDSGVTSEEWMDGQEAAMQEIARSGAYPMFSRLVASPGVTFDLDSLFEFSLARLLDGFECLIAGARRPARRGGTRPRRQR